MDLRKQLEGKPRPKRKKKLPRATYPKALEQKYMKVMSGWRRQVAVAYAPVFRLLPKVLERREKAELAKKADTRIADFNDILAARFDARDPEMEKALAAAAKKLQQSLDMKRITKFLAIHTAAVDRWSRQEFTKQAQAALGVDVFASDPQLAKKATAFVKTNVKLITNLPKDASSRIAKTVRAGIEAGTSNATLAVQLQSNLDGCQARAYLVARDQTGKLYGQINSDRQKSLGITKFIWRTSNDDRVRDSHRDLEGQTFSYDDPPTGDDGEPIIPGEDIQCRCSAEPDFSFLDS